MFCNMKKSASKYKGNQMDMNSATSLTANGQPSCSYGIPQGKTKVGWPIANCKQYTSVSIYTLQPGMNNE